MSLICHICHNQLFPFLPSHNGKTNFAKINSNSMKKKALNPKQAKKIVQETIKQGSPGSKVCITNCGHLFHRDCLKDLFNIRPGLPINNKLPKPCPTCTQKFRYQKCITVRKESFPTIKHTKSSGKLEDIMLKNKKMHEKLYILKKTLCIKEEKYEKLLKKIEALKSLQNESQSTSIDSFTPPPTTWTSATFSSPPFPSSTNMDMDSPRSEDSAKVINFDVDDDTTGYEQMRTTLLDLYSQSKEMEQSMHELQSSMTEFQYRLDLNYRTSRNPSTSNSPSSEVPDCDVFEALPSPISSRETDQQLSIEEPERSISESQSSSSSVTPSQSSKFKEPNPNSSSSNTKISKLEKSRQADFKRIFMGHSTHFL